MKIVGSPRLISVWMSTSCHTSSNASSKSMNRAAEKCFMFLECMAVCVRWKILSCIDLDARRPTCSLFILLLSSAHLVNLIFIIFSNILDIVFISEMGL